MKGLGYLSALKPSWGSYKSYGSHRAASKVGEVSEWSEVPMGKLLDTYSRDLYCQANW